MVDNASSDDTRSMMAREFPRVVRMRLGANRGAVARNLGVAAAPTDLVAFSDDDSWWEPGAFRRAREIFDASPRTGLLAAQIRVGSDSRLDPVSSEMADSPLGTDALGRPLVMGFVAAGAIVRRSAFIAAGGFEDLLFFIGEEMTLALDMVAAGWEVVYAPDVVAHHRPDTVRDDTGRRRQTARNRLVAGLIHQPPKAIVREALRAGLDRDALAGLGRALKATPRALAERRPLPGRVEEARQQVYG